MAHFKDSNPQTHFLPLGSQGPCKDSTAIWMLPHNCRLRRDPMAVQASGYQNCKFSDVCVVIQKQTFNFISANEMFFLHCIPYAYVFNVLNIL